MVIIEKDRKPTSIFSAFFATSAVVWFYRFPFTPFIFLVLCVLCGYVLLRHLRVLCVSVVIFLFAFSAFIFLILCALCGYLILCLVLPFSSIQSLFLCFSLCLCGYLSLQCTKNYPPSTRLDTRKTSPLDSGRFCSMM